MSRVQCLEQCSFFGPRSGTLYCPRCKVEYGAGMSRCPACAAALVDATAASIEPDDELIDLFKTADIALLMVVKSVLESSGIPFMVQGEEGLHVLPLNLARGFYNTSAYGAVIRVRRKDLADAQKSLEETVPPADDVS